MPNFAAGISKVAAVSHPSSRSSRVGVNVSSGFPKEYIFARPSSLNFSTARTSPSSQPNAQARKLMAACLIKFDSTLSVFCFSPNDHHRIHPAGHCKSQISLLRALWASTVSLVIFSQSSPSRRFKAHRDTSELSRSYDWCRAISATRRSLFCLAHLGGDHPLHNAPQSSQILRLRHPRISAFHGPLFVNLSEKLSKAHSISMKASGEFSLFDSFFFLHSRLAV